MTQQFAYISRVPTTQLAARRKIIVLGDSISALAIDPDSPHHGSWSNHGYVAWLRRYLKQSVNLPFSNLLAVSGVHVSSVVANQLPAAIASGADIAIVHCGINSITSTTPPPESLSTIIAGLTMIYQSLLNAGMFVIAIPIMATAAPNALSGANLQKFCSVNSFIASFCANTSGMLMIDVNPTYLDFSTGQAQSNYLLDGIHDVQLGAMTMARLLANTISPLIPTTDDLFMHVGDVFNLTNNITGNLIANGLLQTGTGGPVGTLANGATGTVPDQWTGYRGSATSATTLAFSLVADPSLTNLNRTRMTIGGTADGVRLILQQSLSAANWVVGDTLTAEAACTWNIATGGMTSIGLHIVCFDSSSTFLDETFDGDPNNLWHDMPVGMGTVVYRTDPLKIPANTAQINVDVTLQVPATGAVAATVDWSRFSVRKV
jgi:lysophospholipase L1-like esterase